MCKYSQHRFFAVNKVAAHRVVTEVFCSHAQRREFAFAPRQRFCRAFAKRLYLCIFIGNAVDGDHFIKVSQYLLHVLVKIRRKFSGKFVLVHIVCLSILSVCEALSRHTAAVILSPTHDP